MLKELSEYATDADEKARLRTMASNQGKVCAAQPHPHLTQRQHDYQTWVHDDHRTVLHVLQDLKSVKPPLDLLLELLPRLQCRYYSISSSAKVLRITCQAAAPTRTAAAPDPSTRHGRRGRVHHQHEARNARRSHGLAVQPRRRARHVHAHDNAAHIA